MTELTPITFFLAVNDAGDIGTSRASPEDAAANLYWDSGITRAVTTFLIVTALPLPQLGEATITEPQMIASTTVGRSSGSSRSWSTSTARNLSEGTAAADDPSDAWKHELAKALKRHNPPEDNTA